MSRSECCASICSVWWGLNGLGASGVAQVEWEVLMRGDGGGEVGPKPGALTPALLTLLRRTPLRGERFTDKLHNAA